VLFSLPDLSVPYLSLQRRFDLIPQLPGTQMLKSKRIIFTKNYRKIQYFNILD
jgi:hypothetical protein